MWAHIVAFSKRPASLQLTGFDESAILTIQFRQMNDKPALELRVARGSALCISFRVRTDRAERYALHQGRTSRKFYDDCASNPIVPALFVLVPNYPEKAQEKHYHGETS